MNYDVIEKWYKIASKELCSFIDDTAVQMYKKLDDLGLFLYKELENEKGIVAYTITKDMLGNSVVGELFMYVKKEHRGNPKNFMYLIKTMEQEAKKAGCESVIVGSNIGYRDEKVLNLLIRMGYKTETVRKKMSCKK